MLPHTGQRRSGYCGSCRDKILRVFCQAVEVRRQDVAAQGQFIGDFLEGEILFIARFNQVTPVGDALARHHIEETPVFQLVGWAALSK